MNTTGIPECILNLISIRLILSGTWLSTMSIVSPYLATEMQIEVTGQVLTHLSTDVYHNSDWIWLLGAGMFLSGVMCTYAADRDPTEMCSDFPFNYCVLQNSPSLQKSIGCALSRVVWTSFTFQCSLTHWIPIWFTQSWPAWWDLTSLLCLCSWTWTDDCSFTVLMYRNRSADRSRFFNRILLCFQRNLYLLHLLPIVNYCSPFPVLDEEQRTTETLLPNSVNVLILE